MSIKFVPLISTEKVAENYPERGYLVDHIDLEFVRIKKSRETALISFRGEASTEGIGFPPCGKSFHTGAGTDSRDMSHLEHVTIVRKRLLVVPEPRLLE